MTIDRTPAYWALTATLVLAYIVSVAMLQALYRVLTGQESQLADVLDLPRRCCIQSFIDRQLHLRNLERRSRP